jgi:hypothetical protein
MPYKDKVKQRLAQKESKRRCYRRNKKQFLKWAHESYQRAKAKVIEVYGGKCVCCGETIIEFLTVDHIDGKGSKHRRELKISSGGQFYYWLLRNNCPKGFQVMCWNCNHAKGTNRVCPHQVKGI